VTDGGSKVHWPAGGRRVGLAITVMLGLSISSVMAGGARVLDDATGEPVTWSTTVPVSYQVDRGPLGTLTSNQAMALVQEAFATLEGVETASIRFQMTGQLPVDVNETNWGLYLGVGNDGRNPVIFDADGRILDQLLGLTARNDVEGGTLLEQSSGTELLEAAILINGACFDGVSDERSPCELQDLDELRALVLHEAGHFCNLDHTDLNRRFADDGNPANNVVLPTMYAVQSEDDSTQVSLQLDDELALSRLYPAAGFPGTGGIIEGTIFAPNGSDPVDGANVVVRNLQEPFLLAASTVSGDVGGPGTFRFEGLPPGNYTLEVLPVASSFTGRTSVGQVAQEGTVARLPGPPEFLDAAESGDASDDTDAYIVLTLHMGTILSGENVLLNDLSTVPDDPSEPGANDTPGAATALPAAGDFFTDAIEPGDVDYFSILIPEGWTLVVDVDAADPDLGSGLEAVLGILDAGGIPVSPPPTVVPDPDNGADTDPLVVDPALEFTPAVGGTFLVAVSSVGDEDFDGVGGSTTGPYHLRVEPIAPVLARESRLDPGGGRASNLAGTVLMSGRIPAALGFGAMSMDGSIVMSSTLADPTVDADGDGLPDASDPCPTSGDDDGDGVCNSLDNCVSVSNPSQADGNDNGIGNPCDAPTVVVVSPAAGSFQVPLAESVEVRFSEAMSVASIGTAGDPTSLHLEGPGTALVPVTGVVAIDGRSVTLDPAGALLPDTDYTVLVPGTVEDLDVPPAGVTFGGAAFRTTASTSPPRAPVGDVGDPVPGSGDSYGTSVASDGDVNGDGLADLLVGAPKADSLAVDAGVATLFLGDADGITGGGGAEIVFQGVDLNGEAGRSVAFVGDVNDDGLEDFLIGAPGAQAGGQPSGVAYLVFGQANMADVCSPVDLSAIGSASCEVAGPCGFAGPCGVILEGEVAGDGAGTAVASAGDFNRDGRLDLLVGAPGHDVTVPDARADAGAVYLLYGSTALDGPGTLSLADVGGAVPGAVFLGENAEDATGTSVSGWKDRNEDGIDDLIIGSPMADVLDFDNSSTLLNAGTVHTILGRKVAALSGLIDLRDVGGSVAGAVFLGETANAEVGAAVSGERDVTGDGEFDILIGGPGMSFPDRGRLLVGGGVLIPSQLIAAGKDPIKRRTSGKISLGKPTPMEAGDLEGNGSPTPEALVLRSLAGSQNVVEELEGVVFIGEAADDEAGASIRGAGDVNGDGLEDILLGAPGADVISATEATMPDAGKAYVIFSRTVRPSGEALLDDVGVSAPGLVLEGQTMNGRLGASVAGTGDLDGTGDTELVLGAPSDPGAGSGMVYVSVPVVATQVQDLEVSGAAGGTLEWDPASGASRHLVYRGSLAGLDPLGVRTASATCLTTGGAGVPDSDGDADGRPDLVDAAPSSVGDGFWYLVTGWNQLGEGPLGVDSAGVLRQNNGPCP
jgi:hypothetical protein